MEMSFSHFGMLTELWVKNLALIKEQRLEFSQGFTIFSGETGAGKSLLIESISLLLGAKASQNLIRQGESEALVEGVFQFELDHPIFNFLEEEGLKEDDELIIRRSIHNSGKSQIYINGRRSLVSTLKKISKWLIDLSGQHEQQVLLDVKNHIRLLDQANLGKDELNKVKSEFENIYSPYREVVKEINQLESQQKDKESRIEFLKFQIKEIDAAKLEDPSEEEELTEEKKKVKHADVLFKLSQKVSDLFSGENKSIMGFIDECLFEIEKNIEKDENLNESLELLNSLRDRSNQINEWFLDYQSQIDITPGRIDEIESRLYQIYQLEKKYGHNLKEILEYYDSIKNELQNLIHSEENLEDLYQKKKVLRQDLVEKAKDLTQVRMNQARRLEERVVKELSDLSLQSVQFQVKIISDYDQINQQGGDEVEFQFSANKGEKIGSLSSIASGGELSRILLALKNVMSRKDHDLTFVFDEVDSGIGGGVAEVVGKKLKSISKSNQVFCITHLPQVAALADHHYFISKEEVNDRVETSVEQLTPSKRVEELSRMLGGTKITAQTRKHAKEMIDLAS